MPSMMLSAVRPTVPARRMQIRAAASSPQEQPSTSSKTCATCGVDLSQKPAGCDGTGRVVGGVGAVLPWWPVKAYRPCPKLGEAGLQYTRKGQALNDVLFPTPKQRQ